MNKKNSEVIRTAWVEEISRILSEKGEDVQRTKSNQIAIPVVDSEGDEGWITITIAVPTGTRDGEPYDGYEEAEGYEMTLAKNAAKAAEAAKKKAEKIARDEKLRAEKAAAKARRS